MDHDRQIEKQYIDKLEVYRQIEKGVAEWIDRQTVNGGLMVDRQIDRQNNGVLMIDRQIED